MKWKMLSLKKLEDLEVSRDVQKIDKIDLLVSNDFDKFISKRSS